MGWLSNYILGASAFGDVDDDATEGTRWENPCCPAWTPPLQNFYVGETAYCWYRMVYYAGDDDVSFEECGRPPENDDDPKAKPGWLLECDDPYEDLFTDLNEAGYRDHEIPQYNWGLRHGVSPGQPFLLALQEPRYSGGRYNGLGDYDDVEVETRFDVVRRLPRSERATLLAWEHVLKSIQKAEERRKHRDAHFQRLRMALTHRWEILVEHYGVNHEIIEFKLRVSIPKDPHSSFCLASGRAGDGGYKDGKWEQEKKDPLVAFWRLVNHFMDRYPGVNINPVLRQAGSKVLERFNIEVTRWDYLRLQYGEDHPDLGPVDELF